MPLSTGKLGACVDLGGFQVDVTVEKCDDLLNVINTIDFQVVDYSGLHGIGAWQDETIKLHLARYNGHRQSPLDGTQCAIK